LRTKKIALNIFFDIIPYLLIGIVGLIKVKYLISYVGDVGNGYYQFINQVISYVFLAQAGFSEAVTFSLYKPFANKNKKDINEIYTGARHIFRIIGFIILGIIFLVSLGLYFYYGSDPYRNSALICFVVISCSYLIAYFGKTQTYAAIIIANQEKYLFSIVFNGMKLLGDILTIFVVIKFRNLESIAILIFIIKLIEEIIMRIVVKRKYNWLHSVANKNTSMVKMTKDLVWLQVGHLVLNNIDAILIMFFMGPFAVSVYTSYNFILRFLSEISSRINLATTGSFGNVFAKNENNRAYSLFLELHSLFIIIAFSFCLTFLLGIRSFVLIWINDITYILDYITVFLFSFTLFLTIIYYPLLSIINSNGLFKENKKHIFICAFINVILSVVLINFYDINGVLFATFVSFVVNILLKSNLIIKRVFKEVNFYKFICKYFYLIVLFCVFAFLINFIEKMIIYNVDNLILLILILGLIFTLIFIVTFIILYAFNNDVKRLFNRIIKLLKINKKSSVDKV